MDVAIVTGGGSPTGRAIAFTLAARGDAVSLVYLEDRLLGEATVEAILEAGGAAIGVRADITDELDVARLFSETMAMFRRVDFVVHTTPEDPAVLLSEAARHWG